MKMADISDFQTSGFDVLTMRYLNLRLAHLNDNITRFTSVDLNSSYRKANKGDFDALYLLNPKHFLRILEIIKTHFFFAGVSLRHTTLP